MLDFIPSLHSTTIGIVSLPQGLILDSFKAFARQRDSDFFGIQEVHVCVYNRVRRGGGGGAMHYSKSSGSFCACSQICG